MNEERLEYLVNEMYYNYLEQDEAKELIDYITNLQQENTQLKSVIKEIREYIKEKEKDGTLWTVKSTDEILEILDKYQEGKHE